MEFPNNQNIIDVFESEAYKKLLSFRDIFNWKFLLETSILKPLL